jgi:hypothetical protein
MILRYFPFTLLFIAIVATGQSQSLKEALIKGSWSPSIPIEVLEKSDTLILTREYGIAYGWLAFLKDSAVMISQSQHYCNRMKDGSYVSGTDYRWYKTGKCMMKDGNLKFILRNKIIVLKAIGVTEKRITLLVTEALIFP